MVLEACRTCSPDSLALFWQAVALVEVRALLGWGVPVQHPDLAQDGKAVIAFGILGNYMRSCRRSTWFAR
eukprot:5859526-Amphidinium_carterae.1